MTEDTPMACSLGAKDLTRRLASMAEVGAGNLISHEATGNRHLLRFRASAEARARLQGIVAAEAECCPFLDLALTEEGEDLVLSISAPADAEALAGELAAAFTGA